MEHRQKIMIINNDKSSAGKILAQLAREDYSTRVVTDGSIALSEFALYHPDLVLLDLEFPGADRYRIFRLIRRQSNVPLIVLSSRSDIPERVQTLDSGADDYLSKPYDLDELIARIKAVLRRINNSTVHQNSQQNPEIPQKVLQVSDLMVNLGNYTVSRNDIQIRMPPKEIELLYCLVSSPDQVFTREQLLSTVWGYNYGAGTRTVDVHIKRLRHKLGISDQWEISTVWGIGYKFRIK